MEYLYLIIGLLIGFVVSYLIQQSRAKRIETALLLARQQNETEVKSKEDLQSRLDKTSQELHSSQEELTAMKMTVSSLQTKIEEQNRQNEEEALQRREQQEKFEKQQREQFASQLETVKEQFQNLAAKVLDQSADKLKTQNKESMETLTAPLKDNITKLHDAIFNTNQETAKSTASLSEQLKMMAEQTAKIDVTATRLTNVMRGGNKIQGNWGELILTEILEQNGFKEGINYDVQQTLTDSKGNVLKNEESGRSMVPDVILHYPKNEDVIIDAKMSIEHYESYVNTENEILKKKHADDLVKSIRTQVTNLAKKDYSSYVKPPRHAIDFVIMFVPNEGALQLALATDKQLWNFAFNQHVFITSQQNLMAILKMIEVAWRQYTQTENQMRIYGLAEELLKRVGDFINRFDKIKKDIDSLGKNYEDCYNKVYSGRQSIVQKANEMKALGVQEHNKYSIPNIEEEFIALDSEEGELVSD